MAIEDGAAGSAEPRTDDLMTGGNTNGRAGSADAHDGRGRVAKGPFGGFGRTPTPATAGAAAGSGSSPVAGPSSRAAARPAPAVPLVPPVRSTTLPNAPLSRTGTTSPSPVTTGPTIVTTGPNAVTTGPQPAVGAPSPPAPGRARPPVRTRMARRPRVRKVNRVVRRIDAWSVFKISLVFWAVVFAILLVAGVLLWNLANTTGTITNVEGFIKDLFGLKTFKFEGDQLLRSAWIMGGVLVVGGTALTVTLTVLFNLISDLLGGVRVTVLEEEVMVRPEPLTPEQAAAANGQHNGATPVTRSR